MIYCITVTINQIDIFKDWITDSGYTYKEVTGKNIYDTTECDFVYNPRELPLNNYHTLTFITHSDDIMSLIKLRFNLANVSILHDNNRMTTYFLNG